MKSDSGGWDSEGKRRVKMLWINEGTLLDAVVAFLTGDNTEYQLRLVDTFNHLTECRVVRVHHDVLRRAFGVLLSHPSFEAVPEGGMPPEFTSHTQWKYVKVAKVQSVSPETEQTIKEEWEKVRKSMDRGVTASTVPTTYEGGVTSPPHRTSPSFPQE